MRPRPLGKGLKALAAGVFVTLAILPVLILAERAVDQCRP